jgi:HlyD family secretion protein
MRQAELEVGKAERDLERMRKLAGEGAASPAQLDEAEKAVGVARSRVEAAAVQAADAAGEGAEVRLTAAALRQAQGAEAVARARLDETQLRARAPGRVLTRDVERGDVVSPGRVLLVLAEDGATRLVVQPDEKNLALLRVGQGAEAVADAFPDRPFRCAVSWIAPGVDAARGTVEVRLEVPEPPPFLRTDMTVSVNVEVGRRADALVVAADAVRDAATDPWVLRIESGRAVRRPVRVGLRGEGAVEVLGGLEPGDAVIAPAASVGPGARVRARPAAAGGEPGRAL